jgi:hypothetical protein
MSSITTSAEEGVLISSFFNGTITFEIVTRTSQGELLHKDLKAKYLFRLMLEHYGLENTREIKGMWYAYSRHTTNHEQFTNSYNETHSELSAIESTWTAKIAKAYGFLPASWSFQSDSFSPLKRDIFVRFVKEDLFSGVDLKLEDNFQGDPSFEKLAN